MSKNETALAQLEAAKLRLERLVSRRTQAQVQLEAARQQYAEAVKEAEQAYGTADLVELKARLTKEELRNEQVVAEFVRAVDEFERFIVQIEEALADPRALATLVAGMPADSAAPLPTECVVPATAAVYDEDEDI